jgi:hypothetical protein
MLVNFTKEENVTWPHPFCMDLYVVRVSMSLGLASVLFGSLCCASSNIAWSRIRSVWVSMLSEFLCYLVSLPFCLGLLCCPSFYVTWSHFRSVWVSYVVRVSISLAPFTVFVWVSILSDFLCHLISPRSVLVFMLSEFLCHLVSLPFCMGLYVVRVSMSLGLTSVMHGLLCFPSFYVT